MTMKPTLEDIRRAPKVLLHDHLDGGVRPETIVDLATESGYDGLPTTDPDELRTWFAAASDSGSLERYLETFNHTVAVMQNVEALERVAYECAEDLANDGIVYAEVRYAPELHTSTGLSLEQVVEAVLEGFRRGGAEFGIRVGTLVTAMRHQARSMEIAQLSVAYRGSGVVGFDIAGAEAGYPPTRHLDAFEYLQRENSHFTIHAGAGPSAPSWAGWPRTSATSGSRWRCAPAPTSRPVPPSPSPSIRSACCAGSTSGSPSTPTTG
jgi:adenosine deaminase